MPDDDAPTLDYASARQPRTPSAWLYRVAIGGWLLSALGSVLLVVLIWLARDAPPFLLAVPIVLLMFAAGLTLIAFACGTIYARQAACTGFAAPHGRGRAYRAELLPLSNVLLAIALAVGGVAVDSMSIGRIRLRMTNASPVVVDDVTVVFADGSRRSLGDVPANASARRTFSVPTGGSIDVDVTAGGRTWRQHLDDPVDADDLGGRRDETITLTAPAGS